MTLLAPFIAWVAGGIVAWLAGRYHLDANQQQLVSVDLIGTAGFVVSAAGGLWMHWKARMAPPPNGGTNVQASNLGRPSGAGNTVGAQRS